MTDESNYCLRAYFVTFLDYETETMVFADHTSVLLYRQRALQSDWLLAINKFKCSAKFSGLYSIEKMSKIVQKISHFEEITAVSGLLQLELVVRKEQQNAGSVSELTTYKFHENDIFKHLKE